MRLEKQFGDDHPRVVKARTDLDGPPAPLALDYLLAWSWELYGRSGVSMDGLATLTFTTIRDWAILTDRDVEPHEVQALLLIDLTRRHPPKGDANG